MKIKFVYNSKLVTVINKCYSCIGSRYQIAAITLFPWVFIECDHEETSDELIVHELAHGEQIAEDGIVKFYSYYLFSYFKNLIKYRDHKMAYWLIPYEVEARGVVRKWQLMMSAGDINEGVEEVHNLEVD